MIGHPSRLCWGMWLPASSCFCGGLSQIKTQGIVGRTKVVNHADKIELGGEASYLPSAHSPFACEGGEALAEGGVESLDVSRVDQRSRLKPFQRVGQLFF